MAKYDPDALFGEPAAGAAPAPASPRYNPDELFGTPAAPPPPKRSLVDKAVELATTPATDPSQRPAGERRGGTRRETGKPYVAGDERVADPNATVLDKPPKEQPPPGPTLIEQRGAPINEETASAIKRGVGAMPTTEPARPFSDDALKSAKETLAGMGPEQRANQLARTDLPKWMRSAMQAAAREVDNDEKLAQTMGRMQTQGDQQERERDRTGMEFGRDLLLAGLEGIGTINQIVANVVDPDSQWGKDTAATIQAIRADRSVQAQYQEMQRAARVKGAGGEGAQFAQQLWELLSSPTYSVEEIARQAPLMAAMIGATYAGGGAGAVTVNLAGRAVPAIAIADAIGGGALTAGGFAAGALATGRVAGAVASAGDAGSQVFQQLTDKKQTPDAVLLDNPDFKRIFQENLTKGMDGRQALDAARTSIAVTRSRLAQALAAPLGAVSGGIGLEKVLAYGLRGAGKREAAKELGGEVVEEVGTQMAGNAAVATVDARQEIMEGTGQVAATTLVTSSPLAALTGYMARTPPTEVLAPTQLRAESIKRFDELAAAFGLSTEAVKAVKGRLGDKPADDVPGFLARAVDALNKRGLFGKPVTDAEVQRLDQSLSGAVAPPSDGGRIEPTMDPLGAPPGAPPGTPPMAPAATAPATDASLDAGGLLGTPVDEEAHGAATSPTNALPEPTEGQQKAGNYKKGHIKLGGLDISIENPQGSVRRGVDEDGKAWENTLQHHYGYIRGTEGNDGDHVDTFIKPGTPEDYSGPVFVIDQRNPKTGKFDEHKVMVGFSDPAEAEAAYRSNYAPGWQGLGYLTGLDMPAFKDWVRNGNHKAPFAAGFKEGKGVNQPDLAVPPPVAPAAGAPGGAVPGGGGGNLGSQPAADGGVGGAATAPESGSGAPGPVGAGGVTDATLSDAPDFQATYPRPLGGPNSQFSGMEDDPAFLAKAVKGVHDELRGSISTDLATVTLLRSGIEAGTDPATGQPAAPERLKELQDELGAKLLEIDGALGEYADEFGPDQAQAFQAAAAPTLKALRQPVRPPAAAPAPAAPPMTEAQKKRADALKRIGKVLGAPEVTAGAPVEADSGSAAPAPAAPAPSGTERGTVGMKLDGGQVVLTASGRKTTPFPKVAVDTTRKAAKTVKAVDNWLMENALAEAEARGDDFNARQFRASLEKPQQADKDSAEEYLFGQQPDVVPSILNPLAPAPAAAPSWASSEFAPRIEKALADMEALGEQGIEMARVTRLGLNDVVKAGKLDEARVAFTEDLARKTAGRLNRQPTTWESMTLEQLQERDSTVATLPEPIQQAALAKMNEYGPQLAQYGAKSDLEVRGDWPKEANDIAQKMRDVVGSMMSLAPARYAEAKDYKNRNPDKLGRMEDFATKVLGIDTRAHPGVAMDSLITAGAGVRTRQAKAKNISLYPKSVGGSDLLGYINRMGGINHKLMHQLSFKRSTGKMDRRGTPITAWYNPSGGPNVGSKGRPGGHGLFREGGLGPDELARVLEEGGMLAPGTIEEDYKAADEQAREMITAALNKDEPEGFVDIETRLEREKDDEERLYQGLAAKDAEQAEELRLFLMGEVAITDAEMQAPDDAHWAADNSVWDLPATQEEILQSFGWSDAEINATIYEQQRIADANQEATDAEGTAGLAGEEAGSDGPQGPRAAAAPGEGAPRLADSEDPTKPEAVVNGRERAADVPREECLLLMPCSGMKLAARARADQLYTGSMWQTLRARLSGAPMPPMLIVSAKHGIVRPGDMLDPYDQLLTEDAAADMERTVSFTGLPVSGPIRDVQIVGGRLYRRVMRAALAEAIDRGQIDPDASIREISGEIGMQRQQLGAYLAALPPARDGGQAELAPTPRLDSPRTPDQIRSDIERLTARAQAIAKRRLMGEAGVSGDRAWRSILDSGDGKARFDAAVKDELAKRKGQIDKLKRELAYVNANNPAERELQADLEKIDEASGLVASLSDDEARTVAELLGIEVKQRNPSMLRTLVLLRHDDDVIAAINRARLPVETPAKAPADDFSLQAPSLEDLQAAAARGEAARAAEIAEQRRLAAAEAARKRGLEKQRADEEAAKIRKERADAAVDDFQLGQQPPSAVVTTGDIVGQKDVFADAPVEPVVSYLPPGRDENAIALRKRLSVLKSLRDCLG